MDNFLKIFVISLSFFASLWLTLTFIEVYIKRIIFAIRNETISYDLNFIKLSLFWTLFLISTLI